MSLVRVAVKLFPLVVHHMFAFLLLLVRPCADVLAAHNHVGCMQVCVCPMLLLLSYTAESCNRRAAPRAALDTAN